MGMIVHYFHTAWHVSVCLVSPSRTYVFCSLVLSACDVNMVFVYDVAGQSRSVASSNDVE